METFHSKVISNRYAVIYCDAICLNLRCDSVAKEALNVILGIAPECSKEALDYVLYPRESATYYEEMLSDLKTRGLEQVLRVIVLRQFPKAKHQSCWVHLSRFVSRIVRYKDYKEILDDLKEVYTQSTTEKA